MLTKLLLIFALLVALLAFGIYKVIPVDPELADPWVARVFSGIAMTSFLAGAVGSMLGLGDELAITRTWFECAVKPFLPPVSKALLETEDTLFDGVPVRIYRPNKGNGDRPRGGLVFFHGGGWILGSINSHDGLMAYYAVEANIIVVSVEYRLAPEHPYPVPLEDCQKATEYFIKNAAKFNVDPNRVAIGGDSAGGNIAAGLAVKLRDINLQPPLRAQVLIYPITQLMDFNTPSHFRSYKVYPNRVGFANVVKQYLDLPDEYVEIIKDNRQMSPTVWRKFSQYMEIKDLPEGFVPKDFVPTDPNQWDKRVSPSAEAKLLDPYVSPLFVSDLSKLPEAFVFTAGTDAIRDDGAWYIHRLNNAGVKTTYLNIPDTFHGCLMAMEGLLKSDAAIRANEDIAKFLKRTLN